MSMSHLVVLAVATLVVWGLAMTIGRRLIDRIFPAINRALDTLDDRAVSTDERNARASYRRIQNVPPMDLVAEVERAFHAATPRTVPRSDDLNELVGALPDVAQRFFREHDQLVVSDRDTLLDITLLRAIAFSGDTFVVVGKSDDDEREALYAVRKGDPGGGVVALELDDDGHVEAVAFEAQSVEHFIAAHVVVQGIRGLR